MKCAIGDVQSAKRESEIGKKRETKKKNNIAMSKFFSIVTLNI